jgi:antitoxin component YwqK of YwqJK toxin-antitoxin module
MSDEKRIKLDLGDEKIETALVNSRSGLLYDMSQNIGMGQDVVLPFPQRYLDIAYEYISFLNGDNTVINSNNTTLGRYIIGKLFDLSYFLQDDNLFDYSTEKLLQSWSEFSTVIWSLQSELLSDILLHCPYQVLPAEFISNNKFITEWKKKNNRKIIVLNLVENYRYNEHGEPGTGKKITQISKSVNTQDIYIDNAEGYYKCGQPKFVSIREKFKGVNRQVYESWYDNGKKENVKTWVNHKPSGLCQAWYRNGKPKLREEYNDRGEKNGIWQEWWPHNKIKSIVEYKDGINDGLYEKREENGNTVDRCNYINGLRHEHSDKKS